MPPTPHPAPTPALPTVPIAVRHFDLAATLTHMRQMFKLMLPASAGLFSSAGSAGSAGSGGADAEPLLPHLAAI